MKYFSDVENQIKENKEINELLILAESVETNNSEPIDEGLFSTLFKAYGRLFKSIGDGLGGERGKKWQTFEDSLLGNKDESKKAIKSKNPQDAIDAIEKARKAVIEDKSMTEQEAWGMAALKAFSIYSEHADDEEYKKKIGEYIKTCKEKGGKDAEKIINDGQKAIKKDNEKEKPAEEKPANDGKPTGDVEKNLGTNNQDAVVSPEQLKTGVQQEIKDDTDFLKPLVKTAGIDGEALSNYVTGIIKDAFKEEVKDPDTGVSNYEWKKGAVAAIAASKDGEKRIVNGISAMVCGALILKSENIIDAVYNIKALDPKGVAKKLEKLKNQMTKVDADPNAGE